MDDLRKENERLKTLVLEQQIELKKHCKTTPVRKPFCLNNFLQFECQHAYDWSDFIATFGIESDSNGESDITTRIARLFVQATKVAGIHQRPLHCLDVKRKKMCLKLTGKWSLNEELIEQTVQESVLQIQSKLLHKTKEWQEQHPYWEERDHETMQYVELVGRTSAPVDFSRFYSLLCTHISLPKS
jgi:hypothetical protein